MKQVLLMFVCLFLGIQSSWAQSRVISGVVTSADDGSSIPGASVLVKGTTNGTVTDFDGKFNLKVPDDAKMLQVSFVGMKTQLIEIGAKEFYKIKLKSDAITTEDVVVTALGIKKSPKSVTYAVSEVDGEKAAMKSEPDAIRSLQGKVAGVNVGGSSAMAGSPTRIVIRGTSSFKGNNQPLFVVDGVPFENDQMGGSLQGSFGSTSPISTLDPNDIKSMNVLKGAAAAALYGSRAANGVILITTKSGSAKSNRDRKISVTASSSYSLEQVAHLPDYQGTYGSGGEFTAAAYYGTWGARFDSVDKIQYTDAWYNAFNGQYPLEVPYENKPDNVKDFFRTGSIWDNSVSISGGSAKTSFSVTLSDSRQKSYIPNTFYNRTSVGIGINSELAKNFDLNGHINFVTSERQSTRTDSFLRVLVVGRGWDTTLPYEGPNGENLWYKPEDNPRFAWENNVSNETLDRVVASLKPTWDVTDWLTLSYSLSMNATYKSTDQVYAIGSDASPNKKGELYKSKYFQKEWESLFMLTLKKQLNDDMNIRMNLGQNSNVQTYNSIDGSGSPIIIPEIFQLDNTADKTSGSYEQESRLASVFADATFGYKNYWYLSATARNDWSSTLPEANNSFMYPSVSTSFVFSDFFNIENSTFNSGLVRASWAKVGNDPSPYRTMLTFKTNFANNGYVGSIRDIGFPFNGFNMQTLDDFDVDPDLKPEFTEEWEFGTKLDFFKRRLSIDAAYYSRSSTDQLGTITLPAESGFYGYYTNFGEMTNKGIELSVDATPIKLNDFSWNIFMTFSKNKNKVVSIADGLDEMNIRNLYSGGINSYIKVGEPYGIFKGYGVARDDKGNILIDPEKGLMIKDNKMKILGDPNPDYLMGITNTFTYKGVTLSAVIDIKKGGDMFSRTVPRLLGRGVTKDTEDREHTVVLKGVYGDASSKQPILDAAGNTIPNQKQLTVNELYFSGDEGLADLGSKTADEFRVYDATVYRLSELSLSYDLPQKWISPIGIKSCTVGVLGRNLWFFAPGFPEHTNFDPQVNTLGNSNTQGIEYQSTPSLRRFAFNLKFSF